LNAPVITIETSTAEQTVALGEAIGRCCTAGDVVALQGELGAGKTQLVRGLASGLGLNPRQVSSPTFVMVQEYEPPPEERDTPEKGVRPHCLTLVHIDAYRITCPDELETIGWSGQGEEIRDHAVVAIEWAKLIRPALGEDLLWIEIAHSPDGRRITLDAEGTWQDKMPAIQQSLEEAGLV